MLSLSPLRAARVAVTLLALALAGCSHVATTRTGFLDRYEELKPDAKDARRLVFEKTEWKKADFASVAFEPTVVRFSAKDEKKVTAEESKELAAYCDAALRKAFEKDFKIAATAAEAKALRIRAAVTGIDTSNPALNVVSGVLLWPMDYGGVSLEFEVLDASTGERLNALVGYSQGAPWQVIGSFSRFGHAHSGIDHWVAELRKIVRPAEAKPTPK
jgi:Protein of unknown function (DUF3313)